MSGQKILAIAVSTMIGAAIIYGFIVAGSPSTARQIKLDGQRLGDLRQMSQTIQRYAKDKGELPIDLALLIDDPQYTHILGNYTDQETGNDYEYQLIDKTHFELCAVFFASSDEQDDRYYREPYPMPIMIDGKEMGVDPLSLPRPEGRHCYSLTVSFEDKNDTESAD